MLQYLGGTMLESIPTVLLYFKGDFSPFSNKDAEIVEIDGIDIMSSNFDLIIR